MMSASVGFYIRLPVALRAQLGAAASARHNGYAARGDLKELVIEALEQGLQVLSPPCGEVSAVDGAKCVMSKGHAERGDVVHSNGVVTWRTKELPRKRAAVPSRRKRRSK